MKVNWILLILSFLSMAVASYLHFQNDEVLIPNLNGREVVILAWTDDTTITNTKNGQPSGILPNYYEAACEILNCKPKFIVTDINSAITLLYNGDIDTTFGLVKDAKDFGWKPANIPVIRQRHGVAVLQDSPYQTLEDALANPELIVPIKTEWNIPELYEIFKNQIILENWEQAETNEILLRGISDLFLYTGVEIDGQVYYDSQSNNVRLLDGNPNYEIVLYPIFPGDQELAGAFDIATAILLYNRNLDNIIRSEYHYEGVPLRLVE